MKTTVFRYTSLAVAISILTACNSADVNQAEQQSPEQVESSNTASAPTRDIADSDDLTSTAVGEVLGNSQSGTSTEPTQTTNRQDRATREVVVTGSRIRTDGMTSPNPVEVVTLEQVKLSNPATGVDGLADLPRFRSSYNDSSGENYDDFADNKLEIVNLNPVSTFSIDVDTGAYSNARRFLNNGQLPVPDAVRAEEFINYFSYDYSLDREYDHPFATYTEIAPSPYNPGKHLVHIGIKAMEPDADEERHSNLVFLVDVSGSMNSPDKLELLKTSLKMLTRELSSEDSISLVVYAGASGVVLEPTAGNETTRISHALDHLRSGGSTNGGAGIELAYRMAEKNFIDDGINRVILATDGDFNVGTTSHDALIDLIQKKRASGIGLTTLGFGTGNYNDHLMEQLADAGNGNYAYIDNLNEARKVLVDEGSSTLQTVAKDVKIQVEFNPSVVSEYRLVGYENRALATEDFNNDNVDAGEIGAGHTVTALYEISLVGSGSTSIDPLRYGSRQETPAQEISFEDEVAYLKLRYKRPDSDTSTLIEQPLLVGTIENDINQASDNYRFSAAVAGLAQLLRNNDNLNGFDFDYVISLATSARGDDPFGYRSEFINLAKTAQALTPAY